MPVEKDGPEVSPGSLEEILDRIQSPLRATLVGMEQTLAGIERTRRVMSDPVVARVINAIMEDSSPTDIARPRVRLPEHKILPEDLSQCKTQEQVAELLARANGGVVRVEELARQIRRLGLTNATTERGLRRNVSSRLVENKRWVRDGVGVIRKVGWDPDKDGPGTDHSGTPAPLGDTGESPGLGSEPTDSGDGVGTADPVPLGSVYPLVEYAERRRESENSS